MTIHHTATRIALAAACSFIASNAFAQIYINGNLSSGTTTESGVAAAAGAGWSELQHDVGVTIEGNGSAGLSGYTGAFRLADDFIVPAGVSWTLSGVVLYSYKTGSAATPSPFTAYTLQIWNGRPGDVGSTVICGDTTTNVLSASTDTNLFRIFNSVVPPPGSAVGTTRRIWRNVLSVPSACAGVGAFTTGTYWLDWASTDSAGTAHFDPTNVVPGARNRLGDNARQQTVATSAWADANDGAAPAAAVDVVQDFPFELLGVVEGDLIFEDDFEL